MEREDWDRRYETAELIWKADPNRFVAEEVTGLPPGRALDLAAGEGRNAVWLARQGWQVTAVDFSATGLAKGRRLAEHHSAEVDWVLADVLSYVPERGAYDLVLIAYLHIPHAQWYEILPGLVDALAPGGTLLVVGHDATNLTDGVGGPQDPGVLYSAESIAAELSDLDVQRAGRVRREVETEDGVRYAVDTLVRAVRR